MYIESTQYIDIHGPLRWVLSRCMYINVSREYTCITRVLTLGCINVYIYKCIYMYINVYKCI